ncbi:MAG: discoidin domain-containing protein, partial [Thermoplasmata archaeon]|nr:discoidin domain-containing protein [Thermoplasmata archaeon]
MSGNHGRMSQGKLVAVTIVALMVMSTFAAAFLQAYGDDLGRSTGAKDGDYVIGPQPLGQETGSDTGFLNATVAFLKAMAELEGSLSNMSTRLQALYREFIAPTEADEVAEPCSSCGAQTTDVQDLDVFELIGSAILSEEGDSTLDLVKAYALETLIALYDLRAESSDFADACDGYSDFLADYAAGSNGTRADEAAASFDAAADAVNAALDDLSAAGDRLEETIVPVLSRSDAVDRTWFVRRIAAFQADVVAVLDELHAATSVDPDAAVTMDPLSHFPVSHSAGDSPGLSPDLPLSGDPVQADLGRTEDAWVSESVYQKAHSMDAEKLYWWVLEGVAYEPYIGSLKGSDQTLMQRAGNDVDQASLLIAMLREREIPARYVYGTVRAPGGDVAEWLMTDTQDNATALLRSCGVPADNIGGDIIFEHFWVAAYVDDAWVEMDPSWDPEPLEPIDNVTVIDGVTYFNGTIVTTPETEPDLSGRTEFPSGLPYDVTARLGIYQELPDAVRHTVDVTLSTSEGQIFNHSGFAGRLASQGIGLEYTMTQASLDLARAEGHDAPTFMLEYTAALDVGGSVAASSPVVLDGGEALSLTLTFTYPWGSHDTTAVQVAGVNSSVVLDAGKVSQRSLEYLFARDEEAINGSFADAQEPMLALSGSILLSYLAYSYDDEAALLLGRWWRPMPAAVVVQSGSSLGFGAPLAIAPQFSMDLLQDPVSAAFRPEQASPEEAGVMFTIDSGLYSAYVEAMVGALLFNASRSISFEDLKGAAEEAGIPLIVLTADNYDGQLLNFTLPTAVSGQIEAAVALGYEVRVIAVGLVVDDSLYYAFQVVDPETGAVSSVVISTMPLHGVLDTIAKLGSDAWDFYWSFQKWIWSLIWDVGVNIFVDLWKKAKSFVMTQYENIRGLFSGDPGILRRLLDSYKAYLDICGEILDPIGDIIGIPLSLIPNILLALINVIEFVVCVLGSQGTVLNIATYIWCCIRVAIQMVIGKYCGDLIGLMVDAVVGTALVAAITGGTAGIGAATAPLIYRICYYAGKWLANKLLCGLVQKLLDMAFDLARACEIKPRAKLTAEKVSGGKGEPCVYNLKAMAMNLGTLPSKDIKVELKKDDAVIGTDTIPILNPYEFSSTEKWERTFPVTLGPDEDATFSLTIQDTAGCTPTRIVDPADRPKHTVSINLECDDCEKINPESGKCCDNLTGDDLTCCLDPDNYLCKLDKCKQHEKFSQAWKCCMDPYQPGCDPCQDPKDCPPYSPDDVYILGSAVVNVTSTEVASAEIGIVEMGFPLEMATLVNQTGRSTRFVDLATVSMNDLYDLKVLVVPSGGLYSIADPAGASDYILLKLRLFLENGGNIVVFTQQYGYEMEAFLGAPEGYGYQEDQNCLLGSVYIENYIPLFAPLSASKSPNAKGEVYLDLNVDGFFTRWPENATVLLTRAANAMPAMIAYPWGEGAILFTTMYPDFAMVFGSGTADEVVMMDAMLSWLSLPDAASCLPDDNGTLDDASIETFRPDETVTLDVEFGGLEAEYAVIVGPNGSVVDCIRADGGAFPGLSGYADHGIYRVDHVGMENGWINVTVEHDVDGFAVSLFNESLKKVVPEGIDFWVIFDKNYYYVTGVYGSPEDAGGEPGFVTFFIHNHEDTDFNGSVKFGVWGMGHVLWWGYGGAANGWYHKVNVNVPAGEFREYTERFATSQWDFRTVSYLYSGPDWSGDQIAFIERRYGVLKGQNSIVYMTLDQADYAPSETINVTLSVFNPNENELPFLVKLSLMDGIQQTTYVTRDVNMMVPGRDTAVAFGEMPAPTPYGRYLMVAQLFMGSKLQSTDREFFDVGPKLIVRGVTLPSPIVPATDNTVTFEILNDSPLPTTGATLEVTLYDPYDVALQTEFNNFSLGAGETGDYDVIFAMPTPAFGVYYLAYELTWDVRSVSGRIEMPNRYVVSLAFDRPFYRIREDLGFTLEVSNVGRFDQDLTVNVSFPDTGAGHEYVLDLSPGELGTETGTFHMEDHLAAGTHVLNASVTQGSTSYHEFTFTIPTAQLEIAIADDSFMMDDPLEVILRNDGGIDTNYTLTVDIFDPHYLRFFRQTDAGAIMAGENVSFLHDIFDQALSGEYFTIIWARDSRGELVQMTTALIIDGLTALVSVDTNKTVYYVTDDIEVHINVTNQGRAIANGTVLVEAFTSDLKAAEGDSPWYSTKLRYRLPLMINTSGIERADADVALWLNFTRIMEDLGLYGRAFDSDSLLLVEYDDLGRILWEVDLDVAPGTPVPSDLYHNTYSPRPKMLYLVGGRTDYNLNTRVGGYVSSVTRVQYNDAAAATIMDQLDMYDIVIYDGMQSVSEFSFSGEATQAKILDYVRNGGMFVLMCPNNDMDAFGVHHVSGWRNNNVVVVDPEHALSEMRGGEDPNYWSASETNGYWTNWLEDEFDLIMSDSGGSDWAVTIERKIGLGVLVLDAHEVGYPGNTAGNWKGYNHVRYSTHFQHYRTRAYDPETNAVASLMWTMNGTTAADQMRFYSLYFNTLKGDPVPVEPPEEEVPAFMNVRVLDEHVNGSEEVQISFNYMRETNDTVYSLVYSYDSNGTFGNGTWDVAEVIEAGTSTPTTCAWGKGYYSYYTYGLAPVAGYVGTYDSAHGGYASYGSEMPPAGFYDNDILFFDGFRYNSYVDSSLEATASGHMVVVDYFTFSEAIRRVPYAGVKSFSSGSATSRYIYYGGGVLVEGDQNDDGYLGYEWYYESTTTQQEIAAHFRALYDSAFIFKAILPPAGVTTTAHFFVSAYDEANGTWENSTVHSFDIDGDGPDIASVTDHSAGPAVDALSPIAVGARITDGTGVMEAVLQFSYDGGETWETSTMRPNAISGTEQYDIALESDHPYSGPADEWMTIEETGVAAIRVHMVEIALEEGHDMLRLYDGDMVLYQTFTGLHEDVWSAWIPGDVLHLRFTADDAIGGWGFLSDAYETDDSYSAYAAHLEQEVAYHVDPNAWRGDSYTDRLWTYEFYIDEGIPYTSGALDVTTQNIDYTKSGVWLNQDVRTADNMLGTLGAGSGTLTTSLEVPYGAILPGRNVLVIASGTLNAVDPNGTSVHWNDDIYIDHVSFTVRYASAPMNVTEVLYRVAATDLAGNTAVSPELTATVDSPPWVGMPTTDPFYPKGDDDVAVSAVVTDGEGIDEVLLVYATYSSPFNLADPAMGTVVTANNQYSSQFSPAEAVDGYGEDGSNQDHYWLTSNYPSGAYLQLEFVRPYVIDTVHLLNTRNAVYWDRSTAAFHLSVSMDGVDYQTIYSGTLVEDDITNWQVAEFKPVLARFVRFHVDSYYGAGGGLAEIDIYSRHNLQFVEMSPDGDTYSGDIPATDNTTYVYYFVMANDTWGHTTLTDWRYYLTDDQPPEVLAIATVPTTPSPGTDVNVTVSLGDNLGIRGYSLFYSYNGVDFTEAEFSQRTSNTDVDRDGRPEIVAGSYYGTYVFNETLGVEYDLDDDVWNWAWGSAFAAGDTDLDGRVNLVAANQDTYGTLARVYQWNGSGYDRLADLGSELDTSDDGTIYSMDIGDFDGNGIPDIVIPLYYPYVIYVYEWSGFGYVLKHVVETGISVQVLRMANIDDDPAEEILCGDWNYIYAYDLVNGAPVRVWTSTSIDLERFEVGHLDSDGYLEIVAGGYDRLYIYEIDPDGIVLEATSDALGYYVNPSRIMDWDGDGRMEVSAIAYNGYRYNASQSKYFYYYNITVFSYRDESEFVDSLLAVERTIPIVSPGYFNNRPAHWGDFDADDDVEFVLGDGSNYYIRLFDDRGTEENSFYSYYLGSDYESVYPSGTPSDWMATIPGAASGTIHYYVEVEDLAGNVNASAVMALDVDGTPPTIDDTTEYPTDRNALRYVPIFVNVTGDDVLGVHMVHDAMGGVARTPMVDHVFGDGVVLHYADCGLVDEDFLVQGDPTSLWKSIDPHTTPSQRSVRTHADEVVYRFPVDPARSYAVDVVYLQNAGEGRVQRLLAGTHVLHGPLALPENLALSYRLPVPAEAYADGNLTLTFQELLGESAVVSEITVREYSSAPATGYLAYVPPAFNDTDVHYYVEVADLAMNTVRSPTATYRTFGANHPPVVADVDETPSGNDIVISAEVTDADGIGSANLRYSYTMSSWTTVAMTHAGDTYSGTIDTASADDLVYYFIEATDVGGVVNRTPVYRTNLPMVGMVVNYLRDLDDVERSTYYLLSENHFRVELIDDSDADVATLSNFDVVVVGTYYDVDSTEVAELIDDHGIGVVLVYQGVNALGFGIYSSSYTMQGTSGEAFMEPYRGSRFQVQYYSSGYYYNYYYYNGYPAGWTCLDQQGTAWTSGYRVNGTSGGRGAIFPFAMNRLTEMGEVIFSSLMTWIAGEEVVPRTVGAGNAILITQSNHADIPVLTDHEEYVAAELEDRGYTVEFVSMLEAGLYDMTGAGLIVVCEHDASHYLGLWKIEDWVDEGLKVLLLGEGGYNLGGSWTYYSGSTNYNDLTITYDSGHLSAYSGYTFTASALNAMYFVYSGYPAGWNLTAYYAYSSSYYTLLHRDNASSGGKAFAFGYDIRGLTEDGWWLFNLSIDHLEGVVHGTIPMPADTVVLAIAGLDYGTPVLTERERTLRDLLLMYGFDVSYISVRELRRADLSSVTFLAFAEYNSRHFPGAAWIDAAIDDGTSVGFYAWSAQGLGGSWSSSADWRIRQFYGETELAFASGLQGYSFYMASSANTPFIYGSYPSGWTVVGRNAYDASYKSAFHRENSTSGGRGTILTYEPNDVTYQGEHIFGRTFEYLANMSWNDQAVVPGSVVMAVEDPDNIDPAMTAREAATDAMIRGLGYEVSYVSRFSLRTADLSYADLVVVPYYLAGLEPGLPFWQGLIDSGVSVLMLYDEINIFGGSISYSDHWQFRQMYAMSGVAFLEDFDNYVVQFAGGYGYIQYSTPPLGWMAIGRNTYSGSYNTVFYNVSSAGGRGAMICYDPLNLWAEGRMVMEQALAWLARRPVPRIEVPEGNAVLLTVDSTMALTSSETAARDLLVSYGYAVTLLPQILAQRINFTNASVVALVEYQQNGYFVHGDAWATSLMAAGIDVLLLRDSGKALWGTGGWNPSTHWQYVRLVVESETAFLEDHLGQNIYIQGGTAHRVASGNIPATWTPIGRNYYGSSEKTVIIHDNATTGGRGAVITYDPYYFVEAGRVLLNKTLDWLAHVETERIQFGTDVVIATLSEDYGTPTLTTGEQALRDRLLGAGYSVSYVSYKEMKRGNYTDVRAVMATAYDDNYYYPIGQTFIDSLIDSGVSVGLFYRSGQIVSTANWNPSTHWMYVRLVVESSEAFLAEYGGFNMYMQSGTAYRIASPSWPGWTAIGRNYYGTSEKTAMYRESGDGVGRGVVLTYDPSALSTEGGEVYDNAIAYLMHEPVTRRSFTSGVAVLIIESLDASTPTLNAQENATRLRLEGLGYDVEYVSVFRARFAEYSSASVVACAWYEDNGYYHLGNGFFDALVDHGTPILLLYDAGLTYGGGWNPSTHSNYLQLYVEDNSTCLSGYPNGATLTPQTGGSAYRVASPSFAGWAAVGRNTYGASEKTVLTRENATSGGRGVMLTYDPYYYNAVGMDVFNASVAWVVGSTILKPDLTVSLAIGPMGYRTDVYLNATISNSGDSLFHTTYSLVAFYDGADIIGIDRVAVPASGSDVTATVIWNPSHGGHTVTVVADATGAIAETNEGNNADSTVVSTGRPDLRVTGIACPSPPLSGELATVNVTVRNDGSSCGEPFHVDLLADGEPVARHTVASLAGGSSVNVSFQWTALPGGTWLTAFVDQTNEIPETDEMDNTLTIRVHVGSRDLEIGIVSFTQPTTDGETVTFDLTLNNTGDVAAGGFHVGMYLGSEIARTVRIAGIGPHNSTTAAFTWKVRATGTRPSFVVDCLDEVSEDDEANNGASPSIPSIQRADLTINDVRYDSRTYYDEGGVLFEVVVENGGSATLHDVHLAILVDGVIEALVDVSSIGAGGETTAYVAWSAWTGNHTIVLEVDPYDVVDESDEGDNEWSPLPFHVRGPDLMISDVWTWPSAFADGDTISMNATVMNAGSRGFRDTFAVELFVDGASIGTVTVAGLDDGASADVSLPWTASPGTWTLSAEADVNDVVTEYHEDNNGRAEALAEVQRADLLVTDLDHEVVFDADPIGTLSDGDILRFNATVENIGAATNRSFAVRFYRNGTALTEYVGGTSHPEVTFPGLEAGGTDHAEFTYIMAAGNYNFTAAADANGAVEESDETNNGPPNLVTVAAEDYVLPDRIPVKKGTEIEVTVVSLGYTSSSYDCRVYIASPTGSVMGSYDYETSDWGTRTLTYTADAEGNWTVGVWFEGPRWDLILYINVTDADGMPMHFRHAAQVGSQTSTWRYYYLEVNGTDDVFTYDTVLEAEEGQTIEITVESLRWSNNGYDPYVRLRYSETDPGSWDSVWTAAGWAMGSVESWGTRSFDYILEANGTWCVDVYYQGLYWAYNITITIDGEVVGTHVGCAGSYASNHRHYFFNVTDAGYSGYTYDSVIDVPTGTRIRMSVESIDFSRGDLNGHLRLYDDDGRIVRAMNSPVRAWPSTTVLETDLDTSGQWYVLVYYDEMRWEYGLSFLLTYPNGTT